MILWWSKLMWLRKQSFVFLRRQLSIMAQAAGWIQECAALQELIRGRRVSLFPLGRVVNC